MAKIQVSYDSNQEIEQIIKTIEQHIDMKKDEKDAYDFIQKILQQAFDEGRRFQKQLNINSNVKDSVMLKADI